MDARRLFIRLSPALVAATLALPPHVITQASAAPWSRPCAAPAGAKCPYITENKYITDYNTGYFEGDAHGFSRGFNAGCGRQQENENETDQAKSEAYNKGWLAGKNAGYVRGFHQAKHTRCGLVWPPPRPGTRVTA